MTRLRVEENITTVSTTSPYWTFTGAWSTNTTETDATTFGVGQVRASGGLFQLANGAAGAVATLIIPAGCTPRPTSVILRGPSTFLRGAPVVRLDGSVVGTWDQWSKTGDSTVTYWHRAPFPPIAIPNDGAAHTITVTTGGTNVSATIDCADCYTAEVALTNTIVGVGHSIMYGYDATSTPSGNPLASPFLSVLATLLSSRDAVTYAVTNNGVSSSVLAQGYVNGGSLAGQAGGYGGTWNTSSTPNPTPVQPEDWVRLDNAPTLWEAAKPKYALIMYGVNDVRQRGTQTVAGDPNPSAALAGDPGYSLGQFLMRMRSLIWQMNANCPACQIIVLGATWSGSNAFPPSTDPALQFGGANSTWSAATGQTAVWQRWTDAMAAMCNEPTMNNVLYHPLNIPMAPTVAATGAPFLAGQSPYYDFVHPNQAGATMIGTDLYNRLAALQARGGHGLGGGVF